MRAPEPYTHAADLTHWIAGAASRGTGAPAGRASHNS